MAEYLINNINTSPPPGSLTGYLGTSDPDGWVIADGGSRPNSSIYDNLVTLGIGSRSGANYIPPNYKGAFLRGTGTAPAGYMGPTLNTSQTDLYKSHNHTITDGSHRHQLFGVRGVDGGSGNTVRAVNRSGTSSTHSATTGITVNNSGGTETRPFNYGVNWIIKL